MTGLLGSNVGVRAKTEINVHAEFDTDHLWLLNGCLTLN